MLRLAFEGNPKLGFSAPILNELSLFPRKVMKVIRELNHPERLIKVDPNFSPIDNLDQDLFILGSTFQQDQWQVYLMNLKDGSILKRWFLNKEDFYQSDREFSHCSPKTPIMLDDSSLVFAAESSNNLYRIDKNSNVLWHDTTYYYHHSINPSIDGHIWACTAKGRTYSNVYGEEMSIADGYLTKIDVNSGHTLYNKSIAEIFEENELNYLIHGFSNSSASYGTDPIHLNDIEAVMDSSKYWERGDVFFSLRNRSLIVHFRPTTNKVLQLINGPFYLQHDVDILNDSMISLFDNHISALELNAAERNSVNISTDLNVFSRIVTYNFSTGSFDYILLDQFEKEGPYTPTEGLHEVLPNGDVFIESQNPGIVYVISDKETKLRKYLHEPKNGLVEPPQWVRVVY